MMTSHQSNTDRFDTMNDERAEGLLREYLLHHRPKPFEDLVWAGTMGDPHQKDCLVFREPGTLHDLVIAIKFLVPEFVRVHHNQGTPDSRQLPATPEGSHWEHAIFSGMAWRRKLNHEKLLQNRQDHERDGLARTSVDRLPGATFPLPSLIISATFTNAFGLELVGHVDESSMDDVQFRFPGKSLNLFPSATNLVLQYTKVLGEAEIYRWKIRSNRQELLDSNLIGFLPSTTIAESAQAKLSIKSLSDMVKRNSIIYHSDQSIAQDEGMHSFLRRVLPLTSPPRQYIKFAPSTIPKPNKLGPFAPFYRCWPIHWKPGPLDAKTCHSPEKQVSPSKRNPTSYRDSVMAKNTIAATTPWPLDVKTCHSPEAQVSPSKRNPTSYRDSVMAKNTIATTTPSRQICPAHHTYRSGAGRPPLASPPSGLRRNRHSVNRSNRFSPSSSRSHYHGHSLSPCINPYSNPANGALPTQQLSSRQQSSIGFSPSPQKDESFGCVRTYQNGRSIYEDVAFDKGKVVKHLFHENVRSPMGKTTKRNERMIKLHKSQSERKITINQNFGTSNHRAMGNFNSFHNTNVESRSDGSTLRRESNFEKKASGDIAMNLLCPYYHTPDQPFVISNETHHQRALRHKIERSPWCQHLKGRFGLEFFSQQGLLGQPVSPDDRGKWMIRKIE